MNLPFLPMGNGLLLQEPMKAIQRFISCPQKGEKRKGAEAAGLPQGWVTIRACVFLQGRRADDATERVPRVVNRRREGQDRLDRQDGIGATTAVSGFSRTCNGSVRL